MSTENERGSAMVEIKDIDMLAAYDRKYRTRPYVYAKDDKGKPIKKGKKYIENSPRKDIKLEVAEKLLKEAIKYPNSYKNVTEMKKRKEEKRQE